MCSKTQSAITTSANGSSIGSSALVMMALRVVVGFVITTGAKSTPTCSATRDLRSRNSLRHGERSSADHPHCRHQRQRRPRIRREVSRCDRGIQLFRLGVHTPTSSATQGRIAARHFPLKSVKFHALTILRFSSGADRSLSNLAHVHCCCRDQSPAPRGGATS